MCEGKWDLTWVEGKKEIFRRSQPQAQFVLFENSGHTIFSEDSELFFSTLKKFIDNLNAIPRNEVSYWKKRIHPIISSQEQFFSKENKFIRLIETKSIAEGVAFHKAHKKRYPNERLFSESAMNNLGYSFWNKNDNQSAIQVFKMNLEEYPQSAVIYENLGDTYLKIGDKTKAEEYYYESLKIEPNNNWIKKKLEEIKNE